ncbi:hypothetical protein CBS101457_005077 [Exobasidium rhododendri]|nr:hypothetical protein CBS101457_005077 [Exobasidium rhododendri]
MAAAAPVGSSSGDSRANSGSGASTGGKSDGDRGDPDLEGRAIRRIPQDCVLLNQAAINDVHNTHKYTVVSHLSQDNSYSNDPYTLYIAEAQDYDLIAKRTAKSSVNVFAFVKKDTPSVPIMFWLARGESCRIPDKFTDLIDAQKDIQVYKKN